MTEPQPWPLDEVWAEVKATTDDHTLPEPLAVDLLEQPPPVVRLTMRSADEVQAWADRLDATVRTFPSFAVEPEHLVSLVQVDDWGGSGWMLVVRYAQPVTAEAVAG